MLGPKKTVAVSNILQKSAVSFWFSEGLWSHQFWRDSGFNNLPKNPHFESFFQHHISSASSQNKQGAPTTTLSEFSAPKIQAAKNRGLPRTSPFPGFWSSPSHLWPALAQGWGLNLSWPEIWCGPLVPVNHAQPALPIHAASTLTSQVPPTTQKSFYLCSWAWGHCVFLIRGTCRESSEFLVGTHHPPPNFPRPSQLDTSTKV